MAVFGHIVTQETRDKISQTKKAQNLRGERAHNYGIPRSPLTKQLLRVQKLGKPVPPSCHSETRNKKASETMKRRWQNPELRDRMIKGLSGHPSSLKGKKLSPEFCEKIRQARLKQWQSPEYRAKMIAAFLGMRSPNNMELQLLGILNKYHPGEWEFVGNGKVILCGLNPDFINVNGKKQIIEFFGAYWHKPGTASYRIHRSEEYRISEFAKLGFRTLVIWHKELKDEVALVSRINRFTTGAGHEGKVGTYIN